jgi:hypothetical protein
MTAATAAMIGTHSVSPVAAAIAEMTLPVMRMRTALLERAAVAVWAAHLGVTRLPALDCTARLLPEEAGGPLTAVILRPRTLRPQGTVGRSGPPALNRRLPPPAPEERDRRANNGERDGQVRSQGCVRRRRRQRDRYHDPSSRFIMM